jgi:Flp pilus assembly protein TadG
MSPTSVGVGADGGSWSSRAGRRRGDGFVSGDGGAVLVEFALVFPLLAFLTFGIFGAGIVLNQRLSVTQAGREGARYGATIPIDQCTPTTNCSGLNWAQLVQAVTAERSASAVSTSNICVALVSGPGTAPVAIGPSFTTAGGTAPCYVDNSSDTGRRVQVKVSLGTEIEAGITTFPVTLDAQALTRFEG